MAPMTTSRRLAAAASAAALAASIGDLLMLHVANALRPELGITVPPRPQLWLGGALGVLAIPLYALGYRAASALLAPGSPRAARLVRRAGAGAALLGSAIHGLTAVEIDGDLARGAVGQPPLAAVAASGFPLLGLWIAAGVLVAAASLPFARVSLLDALGLPRALVALDPAAATLCLALASIPAEALRSFLAPAAPNLAHLIFFLACARAARATSSAR
jgi:hypothetical protein